MAGRDSRERALIDPGQHVGAALLIREADPLHCLPDLIRIRGPAFYDPDDAVRECGTGWCRASSRANLQDRVGAGAGVAVAGLVGEVRIAWFQVGVGEDSEPQDHVLIFREAAVRYGLGDVRGPFGRVGG